MRKNIEISDENYKETIQQFYAYFTTGNHVKDGARFEMFLKTFLEKIGLDEVLVTQKSRDGGIDLKAIRIGVGGFSDNDSISYNIQAKKNKPSTSISVKLIRELKGTLPTGHKGMFITTAKFSSDAKKESNNDPQRQLTLIDGRSLIESCIDNEIGFIFNPAFSRTAMDAVMRKDKKDNKEDTISVNLLATENGIDKQISANDIRARILRIPKAILENIPINVSNIEVCFNNVYTEILTIDKGRNYLAKVTEAFRKLGLLSDDGSINPAEANWIYENGNINITVKI